MSKVSVKQVLEQLCRQAESDTDLRKRLLEEPERVIAEQEIDIPEDMRVKVLLEEDTLQYYLLAQRLDSDELTIQDLESVAGGISENAIDIPFPPQNTTVG